MNKRKLTKKIVNHTNDFVLGSAITGALKNNITTFSNPKLNIALRVGIFVTSTSVSGLVLKPVHEHTDTKIDAFFDSIETKKTEPAA